MSFIYEKKDPKGGAKRWMARIKVGASLETVSLRLKSSGTKKLAENRAATLQVECTAGGLSPSTREWLGEASSVRLLALLARARMEISGAAAESWLAAAEGYIEAHAAKDSRSPLPDTTGISPERTKKQRRNTVRLIARELVKADVPFMKRPFTLTLRDYLSRRVAAGISPVTLWTADFAYGVRWGEWMYRKGLCEKPDRDEIREILPPKTPPQVVLPPPKEDADAIRFFRDHRNHIVRKAGEGRGNAGVNWRGSKRYMVAWSLLVCIRGLGCRPSEAMALSWATVSKDFKTVDFVQTKTSMNRTVPVLFEWTRDALAELSELSGHKGPVCVNTNKAAFRQDSGPPQSWKAILAAHDRDAYHPKKAQKLFIRHAIKAGFPPHAVANWTGHTLNIQERHYCENKSYLPDREEDLYGDIGTLSEWGERVLKYLSGKGGLLPI